MKQRRHKPSKRRAHSAEFNARVALEALKGIKPINQIATGATTATWWNWNGA